MNSNQAATSSDAADVGEQEERFCVACRYNLNGLGEEPRCPECGLLNIPAAFRQEVWDLVDSGRWFFSGMFHPLRKRPPGWWWALDREGDVRRSFKCAVRNCLIAAIIIMLTGAVADAPKLETTTWHSWVDPSGVPGKTALSVQATGVGARSYYYHRSDEPDAIAHDMATKARRGYRLAGITWTSRIVFEPSWGFIPFCAVLFLWAVLLWACPALVGLCTQIRKGLPGFARAPRTITAAANYESHRAIYTAVLLGAWLAAEWILRALHYADPRNYAMYETGTTLPALAILLLAPIGWVGALRSDYTRQLVRSRFHAARIVVMYAVIFPLALAWALGAAIIAILEFCGISLG